MGAYGSSCDRVVTSRGDGCDADVVDQRGERPWRRQASSPLERGRGRPRVETVARGRCCCVRNGISAGVRLPQVTYMRATRTGVRSDTWGARALRVPAGRGPRTCKRNRFGAASRAFLYKGRGDSAIYIKDLYSIFCSRIHYSDAWLECCKKCGLLQTADGLKPLF